MIISGSSTTSFKLGLKSAISGALLREIKVVMNEALSLIRACKESTHMRRLSVFVCIHHHMHRLLMARHHVLECLETHTTRF